jgi:phage replication O-like protein O
MASPQVDNGFTTLANELLEATYKVKLNGTQFRIVMCVWRYTYGFKRKDHEIAVSFLVDAIGANKRQVQKELKSLFDLNILIETQAATFNKSRKIGFNKDYESWKLEVPNRTPQKTEVPNRTPVQENAQPQGASNETTGAKLDTSTGAKLNTSTGAKLDTQEINNINKNLNKKENFAEYAYAPVYLTQVEYDSLVEKYSDTVIDKIIHKISKWLDDNPEKNTVYYKDFASERIVEWIDRENGQAPKKKAEPKRTYANAADLLTPEDLKEDNEGVDDENAQWL